MPINSMREFLECFLQFFSNSVIRIRSNLYGGRVGTIPLLGVDEKFKKVKILKLTLPVMMNN